MNTATIEAAKQAPKINLTVGPIGLLAILTVIAVTWLWYSAENDRGSYNAGLIEGVGFLLIVVFWIGIGFAKALAWAGWL